MEVYLVGTGAISASERSACTLIDGKILIDCGNGIVKTIKQQKFDIGKIETILITHLHGDHYFDLPFFILSKFFTESKLKTTIYCPIGTEQKVRELSDIYAFGDCKHDITKQNANVEFVEFEELNSEEVLEKYFVNSYLVNHGKTSPAYGYTIEHNGKIVGFSGDSNYCDNINKIVEKSDLSVLDLSSTKRKNTHMCIEDTETICAKYKDKTIVVTHMNDEVRENAKKLNIPNLIVPNDGDKFEI